jgi:hypothetical protein
VLIGEVAARFGLGRPVREPVRVAAALDALLGGLR